MFNRKELTQREIDFLNDLEEEYEKIAVFNNESTFSISNILTAAETLLVFIPKECLNEFKRIKKVNDDYYTMEELRVIFSPEAFKLFENIYDEAISRIEELFPYVIQGEDFRKLI